MHLLLLFVRVLLTAAFVTAATLPTQQSPLTTGRRSASGDTWSALEQDDSICKAGSLQFTGQINVTDRKSIFFWFVEAREDPNNRPVIVWFNGGPGASSLTGMFDELGPCIVNSHGNATNTNPFSWTNFANVLFVDQPAGVGFSTAANESDWPVNLKEASRDLSATLDTFYNQIFPQYKTVPLYLAGESHGGKYVPTFASDIMKTWESNSASVPSIAGIILVDPSVDSNYNYGGLYDMLCSGWTDVFQLNETVCTQMAAAIPQCEKLGAFCRQSMDPWVCRQADEYCGEEIHRFFWEEVEAHRRSPYDLRNDCPNPPVCISFNDSAVAKYLNRPESQALLGFSQPIHYQPVNFALNARWSQQPESSLPSTHDITYLLDVAKIRVLVINGEYDVAINTPGIFRQFNELPWHGQAEYRIARRDAWWYSKGNKSSPPVQGGEKQGSKHLVVASVLGAGHLSPGDQKESVESLVKKWIESA